MSYKEFELVDNLTAEEIDPEQLQALKDLARREVTGQSRAEAYRYIAQHATQQNWWQFCYDKAAEVEERMQP
jgi:hypothetical protein